MQWANIAEDVAVPVRDHVHLVLTQSQPIRHTPLKEVSMPTIAAGHAIQITTRVVINVIVVVIRVVERINIDLAAVATLQAMVSSATIVLRVVQWANIEVDAVAPVRDHADHVPIQNQRAPHTPLKEVSMPIIVAGHAIQTTTTVVISA